MPGTVLSDSCLRSTYYLRVSMEEYITIPNLFMSELKYRLYNFPKFIETANEAEMWTYDSLMT